MVLTDEEENFVKLAQIVLNIVPKYLRSLFIQKWNAKFSEWTSDPVSGLTLLNKIPHAARKNATCFADLKQKILTGYEADWDPTLLVFLLLYSEVKLIRKCRPKSQRKPQLRISEEIDKIRVIRNDFFAHASSMSCKPNDFLQLTTELKCAARNAFGAASEIEIAAILTSKIETQLSEQMRERLEKECKLNEKFQLWTEQIEKELRVVKGDVKQVKGDLAGVMKEVKEVKEVAGDVNEVKADLEGVKREVEEVKDVIKEYDKPSKGMEVLL